MPKTLYISLNVFLEYIGPTLTKKKCTQKLYKTLNFHIFCMQRLYKEKLCMIMNAQGIYTKFLHIYIYI